MLPVTNEYNHHAVVWISTNKDIETSIISEKLTRNDFSKSLSETPAVEMSKIDVPASPLHNWNMISAKKYY